MYGSGYPGPNCGRQISLTCNGKTATGVLVDEVRFVCLISIRLYQSLPLQCPGCPYGGLDLTEGFFSYFADMGVGVLTCSWYYTDGSNGGNNGGNTPSSSSSTPAYTPQDTPTYSPSPTPTPTPTPEYTPTTSSTPPPPTTSSTPSSYPPPPPTTSTTPTTSSTPYTTSSPPPSPTPSPSPSPTPNTNTGSGTDTDGQNLAGLNNLITNYADIVEDCNDE
jgi:hypothetical protein